MTSNRSTFRNSSTLQVFACALVASAVMFAHFAPSAMAQSSRSNSLKADSPKSSSPIVPTAKPQSLHANVRAGVAAYRAGDYQAATTAFEAGKHLSPQDHRVLFDLGCTAAAKSEWQEAVTYLQQATFAEETELATKAHYNLGGVATDRAKTIFGSPIEEADESARKEGMGQITTAIGHYRDCLALQSDHARARRNLELLRTWSKHIRDVWDEQDRQKRRNDLDLAKFLDWLQTEQRLLRQRTNQLAILPSSPKQRYAVRQLSDNQQILIDEVPFLERKIQEELNKAAQGQGIDANQLAQSISYLNSLTKRASGAMLAARADLQKQNANSAHTHQTDSLDRLNGLFLTLSPFRQILQKAIQRQERLVKRSVSKDVDSSPASSASSSEKSSAKSLAESDPLDLAEQSRRQERIAQWARALSAKASQHLEQQPAAATIGPTPEPDSDEARQAAQLIAVRAMYAKAVENSPAIQAASDNATMLLKQNKVTSAQPHQEEALRLLKEISQQAPQQDEQNKDDQDNNDNEQNKDQQNENENSDDKQQQDGEQNDKQNQDGDKKTDDENTQGPDKQGDEKNDQQQDDPADPDKNKKQERQEDGDKRNSNQSRPQKPQQMSQEQVESLLRKVRQREQMRRELERRLQAIIGGSVPVDRDW